MKAFLDFVERTGNRLPHPTMMFVYLCGIILLVSALCALFGVVSEHPITQQNIAAINLLSEHGLHRMLNETVSNFMNFAPVGAVLIAILGIGIADHSGLLDTALRTSVLKAPRKLLTFFVVFTAVVSSIAVDTGYVVLIPLAAMIFKSAGRNPIAGIAAAFAGVSGGFSANILIGVVDALLAGISTEAVALVDTEYEVNAAGNYYFIIASTFLISLIGTWITERIVCPRLGDTEAEEQAIEPTSDKEKTALKAVGLFTLVFVAILLIGLVPGEGFLRDPENNSILSSPFIKGIVTVIALYGGLAGIIYGRVSGRYKKSSDFIEGMETNMSAMASYLVLMFFAAQFVSYFSWSNLGSIIAIEGASLLGALEVNRAVLLVAFIFLTAFINLFIGTASGKWALIAPIFVPMFLLLGISPEATQMAYRIGDSSTNIITPLMPYFGVVVAFAQQYKKDVGIGTLIAMMLPYSIAFLIGWSALLLLWIFLGWPLGPGAPVYVN